MLLLKVFPLLPSSKTVCPPPPPEIYSPQPLPISHVQKFSRPYCPISGCYTFFNRPPLPRTSLFSVATQNSTEPFRPHFPTPLPSPSFYCLFFLEVEGVLPFMVWYVFRPFEPLPPFPPILRGWLCLGANERLFSFSRVSYFPAYATPPCKIC